MKGRCIAPAGADITRYGETPTYAEGLYDLGNKIFAWMVPNGSWGESNAGLVVGAGASLLIDTLWDVPKTQAMLDAMGPQVEGAPLTTLVNTHADGDHFWGNQLLDGVDSLTTARARAEMAHHRPGAMLAFERLGRFLCLLPGKNQRATGHYFQAMCAPYDYASVTHTPAAQEFAGSHDLDIGGRQVRLIEVGPAHTQGDLLVHVPDAKTLFAADILFIGSTPVMWAGPVTNWLKALDMILDMDVETIIPGHGPVTDKDGVAQVKAYWEFARQAARNCYDAGMKPVHAAASIVSSEAFQAQPWASWDSPERMMTNVHLLYREFTGNSAPLSLFEKINVMRHQAILADKMPAARPLAMHGG